MAKTRAETGKSQLEIALCPAPQAAELGRAFIRRRLIGLGYGDLIDDACQIASEMISNAVTVLTTGEHVMQGSIRLRLNPNQGRLLVELWDSSPEMPVLKEMDPFSESGRGLHIIRSLAERFGWYADEERGGKTTWALLT
ncbi:MAG: ATP-binding protein [Actinomadura sp.]